jgi:DNA-binding transcriptional ArsR family regulator
MHPFEVMAEPIRRRIVDILASGEHQSGNLEEEIMLEFGVGRSAVQHHLAYFRRCDWVIVREEESMRWYRLEPDVIPSLERAVQRLRLRWDRGIGWIDGQTPYFPPRPPRRAGVTPQSRKGRRGLGFDPDNPWNLPP